MAHALSAVSAHLRGLADALASVIFPAPCRICGETLDNSSRIPICRSCLASLAPISGPLCERCGCLIASRIPLETSHAPLCHICRRGLYDFEFARSYGVYSPAMARAIILLKHHAVLPLGDWFARRIEEAAKPHPEMYAVDVIVPVPMHRARLRERGYNQADLIARPLAKRLGLPLQSCLLVRTKPRPDKLRLTMRERWRTVRGAYAMHEGAQVDKLRVLLVDDVLTTGATLDACSRALRKAGAAKVVALTVARAIPRTHIPLVSPFMEPDE